MCEVEKKFTLTTDLKKELEEVRRQLYEANETIEAIRTGQVDGLILHNGTEHQLFTLKTADHAYRVFIEKMSEGAITLNADGIILYANSQFAEMVGRPLSQVMGHSLKSFIAEASTPFYETLFQSAWKGDCKGEVEISHTQRNMPVQLSLSPLELPGTISLSIIITDLTVQKVAQKQLEDYNTKLEQLNRNLESSNYDLQQFASVASHDLQDPVRKMLLFANQLKAEAQDRFSETDERYLNKIISSASRMRTLISDVLNYSKLSEDDTGYSDVDMNDVLNEILEDLELAIKDKNAKIIAGELPCLEASRGQLRQLFQNLISNALKFAKTDVAPVIEIKAKRLAEKSFNSREEEGGAYCLLQVTDNGIGFDEKYIPNIFSLFERLHSKEKYEGSGIGLAITKKIIEKHHGLINVKSREGIGSEFEIILPFRHTK
jgi:PAS domain S-box-containing protein